MANETHVLDISESWLKPDSPSHPVNTDSYILYHNNKREKAGAVSLSTSLQPFAHVLF